MKKPRRETAQERMTPYPEQAHMTMSAQNLLCSLMV